LTGFGYQAVTGVGNQGRARIGDKRHIFTGTQSLEDVVTGFFVRMIMISNAGFIYTEVI